MVECVAQALVAASTHHHGLLFAALAGDGRGSAIAAQGVVISIPDGLLGLREHRGGDFSSQPRQGEKDGGVTMLQLAFDWGGQFVQQGADVADAMLLEQAGDLGLCEPGGAAWRRS